MTDPCNCGHDREEHDTNGCTKDCECTWFQSAHEV